jgi:hypothetical protein
MGRILSALVALALASAPAFVASAYVIAPDVTTTATVDTITAAANLTTAALRTATKDTTTTTTVTTASVTSTGNGAPSGTHFNLNIIGVPKDKTADMNNNDGHRIFVQLNGGEDATTLSKKLLNEITRVNKIFLTPAPAGDETFKVLDANATDANGALFQLPLDVSTTWTVWARALGKPGGKANMTTCSTVTVVIDPLTGATGEEVLCSLATLKLERTKNAKFANVSSDLLFITYLVDPAVDTALATCLGITATTTVTLPLFGGCLNNDFWNYQNQGLKLLQLRFYPSSALPPA